MANEIIPGVPIYLNGSIHLIPSITIGEYIDHQLEIGQLLVPDPAATLDHYIERALPIVLLGFRQNYPETTFDDLLDWLDLTTLGDVVAAVLARSSTPEQPPDHLRDFYEAAEKETRIALERLSRR